MIDLTPWPRAFALFAIVAVAVVPKLAFAQSAPENLPAIAASPFLPHDHWSVAAARRLHAANATPAGFDPGSGVITIDRMHQALAFAAARRAVEPLAAAYLRRFTTEFSRALAPARSDPEIHVSGDVGMAVENGVLLVGRYNGAGGWDPPAPVPDQNGIAGLAYMGLGLSHFAVTSEVEVDADVALNVLSLTASTHGWGVFGGRARPGYANTVSGSILNQGDVPFNGAGFFRTEPMRLPGMLRYLGPVGFETMLARGHRQDSVSKPWFWTTRLSLEPFPWIGLHAMRGVYAGSMEEGAPFSAGDLARVLLGSNGRSETERYADNQIAALNGWVRPPLPSLPLMFYWDWGADDSSGGWWIPAARVLGLRLASVPSLPFLGVGAEHITIDSPRDGHGPWYQHDQFRAGWSEEGVLLGHPLGGNGREAMLYANASLLDARLLVDARGYRGSRGIWNVYAPTRAGRFKGAGFSLDYAPGGALHGRAAWSREWGASWSQSALEIGVGLRY